MEKSDAAEILKNKGKLVTVSIGLSMFPMLRSGHDTVVIKKITENLKKYDVALYIRKSDGAYILHRVIGFCENGYIMRGDNCPDKEYGIEYSDVIGVLEEFYRGKLHINCQSPIFRLYSRIAVLLHPIQMTLKRLKKCSD